MISEFFTNDDFEKLSWHDNRVYGIFFDINAEEFRSNLVIDIDYILEWECDVDCKFLVAPADLIFHNVTDLKIMIDWGGSGFMNSGSAPSILDIKRSDVVTRLGFEKYYKWDIVCADNSTICFGASGFTQKLRADPVLLDRQFGSPGRRLGPGLMLDVESSQRSPDAM